MGHSYSTPGGKHIIAVMPKDITKHHGNPADPAQRSYAAIRQQFQTDLIWLLQRAHRGEWDSIQLLAEIGIDAAAALGNLHSLGLDRIKDVARTFQEWPMVISPKPDHPQNAKRLRRELELGKEIPARQDKVLHKNRPLLQREVVFHALWMFLNFRQSVSSLARAHGLKNLLAEVSKVDASREDTSKEVSDLHSVHLSVLNGELRKAEQMAASSPREVKFHRKQLREILAIPDSFPDQPTPAMLKFFTDSTLAPAPSLSTGDVWFDLIINILGVLTGDELEENELLRKLGESRGDVEIRARCERHPPSAEEFNEKKKQLRHDPAVNSEIRARIKEILRTALDTFLSEHV